MVLKLDNDDLNHLIEKISTSDIQEFYLEGEDFKLEIKRNSVNNQQTEQTQDNQQTEQTQTTESSHVTDTEGIISQRQLLQLLFEQS